MTFHMMQFDGEWYPAYCLDDFGMKVVIIVDCPGWIGNVAGLHCIYLLDMTEVVAVALDLLGLTRYYYWVMIESSIPRK